MAAAGIDSSFTTKYALGAEIQVGLNYPDVTIHGQGSPLVIPDVSTDVVGLDPEIMLTVKLFPGMSEAATQALGMDPSQIHNHYVYGTVLTGATAELLAGLRLFRSATQEEIDTRFGKKPAGAVTTGAGSMGAGSTGVDASAVIKATTEIIDTTVHAASSGFNTSSSIHTTE